MHPMYVSLVRFPGETCTYLSDVFQLGESHALTRLTSVEQKMLLASDAKPFDRQS